MARIKAARVIELADLKSVGPATLKDFSRLGIKSVADLAKANPLALYRKLEEIDGSSHDICTLDVFACAVAQAQDPDLGGEKKNWWYWSKIRKGRS